MGGWLITVSVRRGRGHVEGWGNWGEGWRKKFSTLGQQDTAVSAENVKRMLASTGFYPQKNSKVLMSYHNLSYSTKMFKCCMLERFSYRHKDGYWWHLWWLKGRFLLHAMFHIFNKQAELIWQVFFIVNSWWWENTYS